MPVMEEYRQRPGLFLPKPTPVVSSLLVAMGVMYLSTLVLRLFMEGKVLLGLLSLSSLFLRGYIWQVVTHILIHVDVLHIAFNALALYFLGPAMERTVGAKRFLALFFFSGIAGGLLWIMTGRGVGPDGRPIPCIGASGAIFGILGAYAGLMPNRRMMIIPFPILFTTVQLALIFGGATLIIAVVDPDLFGIAHAAHLGGLITGYIYAVSVCRTPARPRSVTARSRSPGFFYRVYDDIRWRWQMRRIGMTFKPDKTIRDSEETDRVLDKMLAKGYSSLSAKERRILEKASEK